MNVGTVYKFLEIVNIMFTNIRVCGRQTLGKQLVKYILHNDLFNIVGEFRFLRKSKIVSRDI